MARDPYAGIGPSTHQQTHSDDVISRLEETRPSLVKRSRKRTVESPVDDSQSVGMVHWTVQGDMKLGDTFPDYTVTKTHGINKYDCSCHHTQHGDSRARGMCSHVVAVLLWRQEHPEWKPASSGKLASTGKEHSASIANEDAVGSGSPAATLSPTLIAFETSDAHADPWSPRDERLTPDGWKPVPKWAKEYRKAQWRAAIETVEAFENGVRLVFADMPTGSGKTLYGDLVARLMAKKAVYMCTTKTLQDQVLEDFPYARVLKGRSNYPTMHEPFPDVTAEDCDGILESDNCSYCEPMIECAYRQAKNYALRSQLAVVNVAYWIREANFVGGFKRPQGLFIIDECDTMEDNLLGFTEFALSKRRLRELGLFAPRKGVHKKTVKAWMDDALIPAVEREMRRQQGMDGIDAQRRARGLNTLLEDAKRVAVEIEHENWIRSYEGGDWLPFQYKPVVMSGYGDYLWPNMGFTVMMSATIISPEEMAHSLGWNEPYAVVRAPMKFKKKNRQVIVAGVASMVHKDEPEELPKLVLAIERILKLHKKKDRVLVHCVSYHRASYIIEHLKTKRRVITYTNAKEREAALAEYLATPGCVMVAPSFERGVDLKDDACRVQIVAKVPFPNLSDPRTSARTHGQDGEAWYAVQTIRALVQMTGRGVRSETDYCTTYILDKQFQRNLVRRSKSLIPQWWRDALKNDFNVRQLTK